jgi:hypothetical protein
MGNGPLTQHSTVFVVSVGPITHTLTVCALFLFEVTAVSLPYLLVIRACESYHGTFYMRKSEVHASLLNEMRKGSTQIQAPLVVSSTGSASCRLSQNCQSMLWGPFWTHSCRFGGLLKSSQTFLSFQPASLMFGCMDERS